MPKRVGSLVLPSLFTPPMNQLTRHQLGLQALPSEGNYLLLQDVSVYHGWPEYPRLRITKPGFKQSISLEFSPSSTNVFHCDQLGGSLPDGVYSAHYAVTPHDKLFLCYNFLRTNNLDCQIESWIQGIDWVSEPANSSNFQTLARLTALRLRAYASIHDDDTKQAQAYYQELKSYLPGL